MPHWIFFLTAKVYRPKLALPRGSQVFLSTCQNDIFNSLQKIKWKTPQFALAHFLSHILCYFSSWSAASRTSNSTDQVRVWKCVLFSFKSKITPFYAWCQFVCELMSHLPPISPCYLGHKSLFKEPYHHIFSFSDERSLRLGNNSSSKLWKRLRSRIQVEKESRRPGWRV